MRRMGRGSSSYATAGWSTRKPQTKRRPPPSKRRLCGGSCPVAVAQRWPVDEQTPMRSELATPRVLIADDQPDVLEALRLLLKCEGYKIDSAGSPAAILEAIDSDEYDAVLMDLNYARDTTSGQEGLDLLSQLRAIDPALPVILMTAWGSVEGAVEAMRRGARDYVQKPWDNQRLVQTLRTQIELGQALRRSRRLEHETSRQRSKELPELIAESRTMQPVLRLMERV